MDLSAHFNGDFGSSRDANVCDGDAKSRSPGRWVRVLELKSSLRMATQIAVQNRHYYHARDWPRHSAQAKQSDERVALIYFSQLLPKFHFVTRASFGRVVAVTHCPQLQAALRNDPLGETRDVR